MSFIARLSRQVSRLPISVRSQITTGATGRSVAGSAALNPVGHGHSHSDAGSCPSCSRISRSKTVGMFGIPKAGASPSVSIGFRNVRQYSSSVGDPKNGYEVSDEHHGPDRARSNVGGDVSSKAFAYMVLAGSAAIYATGLRNTVVDFVDSMNPSADVLALASIEVDIQKIAEGDTMVAKWRGKPIFIRHRTAEEIEQARSTALAELKDPQEDGVRVKEPAWLVVLGVCTHLGCVPIVKQGDYNGWFCPCHGSHYDTSGRIRKGPAPLNLEVPPYQFIEDGQKIRIG